MKVSKVNHRGIYRIKVEFSRNKYTEHRLRSIEDTRWSKTLKAWHIPYTKAAYKQLTVLFPEIEIEKLAPSAGVVSAGEVDCGSLNKRGEIMLEVSGRKIILRMPKNEADIKFVSGLRFSRWNQAGYYWLIPNYPESLEMIKNYFGLRLGKIAEAADISISANGKAYSIDKNEVLVIKTSTGRLRLIFGYVPALQAHLLKLPYHVWDAKNKWWTVPYSEAFFTGIKECIEACNLKLRYEEEEGKLKGKPRITAFDIPNYRKCPDEYLMKLRELRYSENTIRTYTNAFEEFINYYFRMDIKQLDEPQVIAFLRYLVTERKVSQSYQNQAINAIKFYYERVLGGQRKFYFIERPLKEKTLPVVLNMDEVSKIIYHTTNIKHKAMLMITYSAGLRVSEVINLKVSDIDSHRKQIRIVQSKGKRDRFTLLSQKALTVLREYFKIYNPDVWLFEGQDKQQYSVRSLQLVLQESVKKAGIKKKVGMHTLRHSFATHLLENGTSLRYIQSLLGHSNSKTTEIYTHITTKGFDQIISPLDGLDI